MAKHKYIKKPELLWELFQDYVKHERENPMTKTEYVGKEGVEVETDLHVPITFIGFECWLSDQGVVSDLSSYEKNLNGSYDKYVPIITRIKNNCYINNFKGAAVGLFNANLIARKLGLTDKKEVDVKANVNILSIDPLADGEKD